MTREMLSDSDRMTVDLIERLGAIVIDARSSEAMLRLYAQTVQDQRWPYIAVTPSDEPGKLLLAINTFQLDEPVSPDQYRKLIACLLSHGGTTHEDFTAQRIRGQNAIALTCSFPASVNVPAFLREIQTILVRVPLDTL